MNTLIAEKKPLYASIQFLRFFAAMLVVVMHATEAISLRIPQYIHSGYWGLGSSGVDIFFVISGFVMAITTSNKPGLLCARLTQAGLFVRRRIVRIVPLYWFYTLLKMALVVLIPSLALRTTLELPHIIYSFLFIPSKSPWGLVQPILPVGWTLFFEMLFYWVFALAIVLAVQRFIWCLLVFLLINWVSVDYPDSTVMMFYSQSIVFEFVLGLLVAEIIRRYQCLPLWFGFLAVIIGGMLIFGISWAKEVDRCLTWGVGAAFLVLGCLTCEKHQFLQKIFIKLKILGDISYSTYLCHTFVVPALVVVFNKLQFSNAYLITTVCCGLVICCSFISYFYIEKPLTQLAGYFLIKRPTLSISG
jgi:peptidoglycan/LPS O-acetylase OafA/YrhL